MESGHEFIRPTDPGKQKIEEMKICGNAIFNVGRSRWLNPYKEIGDLRKSA